MRRLVSLVARAPENQGTPCSSILELRAHPFGTLRSSIRYSVLIYFGTPCSHSCTSFLPILVSPCSPASGRPCLPSIGTIIVISYSSSWMLRSYQSSLTTRDSCLPKPCSYPKPRSSHVALTPHRAQIRKSSNTKKLKYEKDIFLCCSLFVPH